MAVRPDQVVEESEEEESEDEGDEGVVKAEGVGERMCAEREERQIKRMTRPKWPTEQEVDDHNRTHIPYRNWCPYCTVFKREVRI